MSMQWEVVERGVDWLSASCSISKLAEGQSIERFSAIADELLSYEESRCEKRSRWTTHGFTGWLCGRMGAAVSGGTAIVRLSGRLAHEHWARLVDDSTNVSRIDVAVTVRNNGEWTDVTRSHLYEVRDYSRERNPRLRVTRIDGGKYGNTLTIGSRSSDAYARIYDKERESKQGEYRDCWRYEVEFKRRAANSVADELRSNELPDIRAAEIGAGWVRDRGCQLPWGALVAALSSMQRAESAGGARTLAWLRGSVRGSVQRLIAAGKLFEVRAALGLLDEVYTRSSEQDGKENII